MTKEEICQKYAVSAQLLELYAQVCGRTSFEESDLEIISLLLTLRNIGFDDAETKAYLRLCLSKADTARERTAMLTQKRKNTLCALHASQKQLDDIDYLRYKITQESKN